MATELIEQYIKPGELVHGINHTNFQDWKIIVEQGLRPPIFADRESGSFVPDKVCFSLLGYRGDPFTRYVQSYHYGPKTEGEHGLNCDCHRINQVSIAIVASRESLLGQFNDQLVATGAWFDSLIELGFRHHQRDQYNFSNGRVFGITVDSRLNMAAAPDEVVIDGLTSQESCPINHWTSLITHPCHYQRLLEWNAELGGAVSQLPVFRADDYQLY